MRSFRLLFLLLLFVLPACGDPATPGSGEDRARIEPTEPGSFVLKTVDVGPPEAPVRLDLVGRNVQTDPSTGRVWLEVAVANRSNIPLHPRLSIWISDFTPEDVVVLNADILPPFGSPIDPHIYGFDYSETFGEDGVLTPGETSKAKTWMFSMDEIGGFSFAARADHYPVRSGNLGGIVFWDDDVDGVQDPDERPLDWGGIVRVEGPGALVREAVVDPHGVWTVEVASPGLYSALYMPPPTLDLFAPLAFTTPNPLEIVMVAGPNGGVLPFDDAHFGVTNGYPAIERSNLPPNEIQRDPFTFEAAEIRNGFLWLKIGFSGCGPDHPVRLFMTGDFSVTAIPRARIVIGHDDLDELCDAWFDVERTFWLEPLEYWFREAHGSEHGQLFLEILDAEGNVHPVFYEF